MTPSTATESTSSQSESGPRRRSLSGALTRRFTRNSTSTEQRPTPSKSESSTTTKRRATIATSTSTDSTAQVHVRIVPNIENPSRSLIFDIVDRVLTVGSVIRIGRYSERHANLNCMSFKSKVVSRSHCEVWVETDGKLYIRDTKSSSGTFLNHVRLSPAGNESGPVELHDSDIVQLGVDFQGGREEIYRSVKMRFELNRSSRLRPLSFNLNAFQNLRNLTQQPNHIITPTASSLEDIYNDNNIQHPTTATTTTATTTTTTNNNNNTNEISTTAACHNDNNVDECCICLYALAPFQALFVSPCSHTYHFKCIRPLLQSYPGFQCPICRTYSDLEASVAMEEAEEYTTNSHERSNTISITTAPPADSRLSLQSTGSDLIMASASPLSVSPEALEPIPFEASVPEAILEEQDHNSISPVSPVICSENLPDNTPIDVNNSNDNHQLNQQVNDQDEGIISNTEQEQSTTETSRQAPKRERRSSHIMEKIKMVFFEKRKSVSIQHNKRNTKSRQRPLSYPNMLSTVETSASGGAASPSNTPLSQTLSRQSTRHAASEEEEDEDIPRPLMMII